MIFNIYKQRGETPLECIQKFAQNNPDLKREKMTYLGRLDPLAEGVLLMASGDDIKRKEEFLGLDKEYDFVSIFGFATDTYDVLGKIIRTEKLEELSENYIRRTAMIYEGEREQKYPRYSSKMISKITNEEIPSIEFSSKKINIYKLKFHGLDTLNSKELFGRLLMDISKVNGDFRQQEILTLWRQVLLESDSAYHLQKREQWLKPSNYFLGRFNTHVSSGTYVRGLVNDIGNTLGCGACVLSIKRVRLGNYKIEDSIK